MTAILLHKPKFPHNIGAVVRAMSCYGGGEVFFTEDRIRLKDLDRLPREERMKGYNNAPWTQLLGDDAVRPIDLIKRKLGEDITPVAVELRPNSIPLHQFVHPENALYVFGPEDGSLNKSIRNECHQFTIIPSYHCLNLAAAVYTILYDRAVKRWMEGVQEMPTIEGEMRGWHTPTYETEGFI